MERLTDRKTAADLKRNCEGLRKKGIEPNMSDLRYIKLAEYENEEERERNECYLNCYPLSVDNKAAKAIIDETAIYELSEEPQEETKWLKDNPSLTSFIAQRFTKRR